MFDTGYELAVSKSIRSEDLLNNAVTIVDNTVYSITEIC